MSVTPTTCTETYYPRWSSRGIRGVRCLNRAKFEAFMHRRVNDTGEWMPVCGVHSKRYDQIRPLQ